MYKRKDFLSLLFSESSLVSLKRFGTFLALGHFFTLSFIAIFVKREFLNQELLNKIIDGDLTIIYIGFGVITAQNIVQYVTAKFQSKTNQLISDDKNKPPVEPGPDDNQETK